MDDVKNRRARRDFEMFKAESGFPASPPSACSAQERANAIIRDILVNHLPRVKEGLEKGYVDENQILVIYDHAVRARILTEHAQNAALSNGGTARHE